MFEGVRSTLMGDCFSYDLVDVIGDAFCGLGRFGKLASLGQGCFRNSFTADTLVHTESGLKPIADIEVGERVLAYREWNGQEQYEVVEAVITASQDYQLVALTLEGGKVVHATHQHPFYILGKGWVEADDLQVGDPLYQGDAGTVPIRHITRDQRHETVYNLSVANANTFFVGTDKVLVHNAKRGRCEVTKRVDYSSVKNPPNIGPGKDFTARQKREFLELNREANGGMVKSDIDGTMLTKPQKSRRGVTPDQNEWQFDHIRPKACGGTNCSSNVQITSRKQNRDKSDTY